MSNAEFGIQIMGRVWLRISKQTGGMRAAQAHSLAEVYATVTRLPGRQRLGADEALLFLDDVRSRLTVIALEASVFYSAIASAAASNIVGGTIYDMLLARSALQAGAEVIYTWDVVDFSRLGPAIAKRVRHRYMLDYY